MKKGSMFPIPPNILEPKVGAGESETSLSPFDRVWTVQTEINDQEKSIEIRFHYSDGEPESNRIILGRGEDGLAIVVGKGVHSGKIIWIGVFPAKGSKLTFEDLCARAPNAVTHRLEELEQYTEKVSQRLNLLHIIDLLSRFPDEIIEAKPLRRKIKSFEAIGTSGKTYNIEVWQDRVINPQEPKVTVTPGFIELITSTGQPVNYISKGQYAIVFTSEFLTSNDPNAI